MDVQKKKKGFLRWKLLLVKMLVKIVETTAKKLEYYINLVDNAAAGFKNIDYNSERSSTVGKRLSSSVIFWRRQWHPTPVFLPGESQGWGSLVGCCLWGRTESDTTEAT